MRRVSGAPKGEPSRGVGAWITPDATQGLAGPYSRPTSHSIDRPRVAWHINGHASSPRVINTSCPDLRLGGLSDAYRISRGNNLVLAFVQTGSRRM